MILAECVFSTCRDECGKVHVSKKKQNQKYVCPIFLSFCTRKKKREREKINVKKRKRKGELNEQILLGKNSFHYQFVPSLILELLILFF